MATQLAYRLHEYVGPECIKLDSVPVEIPSGSQVLVAVSKVGMNPIDWKFREGWVRDHMVFKLPKTRGVDFVGKVVALGEGTSRFNIGDRVMTLSTSLGAYAENIIVEEGILARVPDTLADVDAATLPIPALTAWQSLHTAGELRPGMTVLVHGASGTVGAFVVQFAEAEGAKVIGIASAKNREFVLGLGADEFIDYQSEKFEDCLTNVDLILNNVLVGGASETTNRSWNILSPGGAIVSVADPSVPGKAPLRLRGFFPNIVANASQLESIAAMLASGKIKAKVAKVFSRSQLLEAMKINKAGGTTGRLIVDFLEI